MKTDRRFNYETGKIEIRSVDGKQICSGYAAVFYRSDDPKTQFCPFPGMAERIARTAFDQSLKDMDDVRGLFNHDSNMVLGRNMSGTMNLYCDETGLKYEIELPDTQIGRDVATMIKRGDVTGSSFGFCVRENGQEWTTDQTTGQEIRTITNAKLFDVGPVTFPAYSGATTTCRDLETAVKEIKEQREKQAEENNKMQLQRILMRARAVDISMNA